MSDNNAGDSKKSKVRRQRTQEEIERTREILARARNAKLKKREAGGKSVSSTEPQKSVVSEPSVDTHIPVVHQIPTNQTENVHVPHTHKLAHAEPVDRMDIDVAPESKPLTVKADSDGIEIVPRSGITVEEYKKTASGEHPSLSDRVRHISVRPTSTPHVTKRSNLHSTATADDKPVYNYLAILLRASAICVALYLLYQQWKGSQSETTSSNETVKTNEENKLRPVQRR